MSADQHGQSQNTDTHDMAAADRNVGETIHGTSQQQQQQQQKQQKGEISAIVDTIVNKALGFGGASKAEKGKGLEAT